MPNLEVSLYNTRRNVKTGVLELTGRAGMFVDPEDKAFQSFVMSLSPFTSSWDYYLVEFADVAMGPHGWVTARVNLRINADYYPPIPVSWWNGATDMPTGIARWLPYENEGTQLVTLRTM